MLESEYKEKTTFIYQSDSPASQMLNKNDVVIHAKYVYLFLFIYWSAGFAVEEILSTNEMWQK